MMDRVQFCTIENGIFAELLAKKFHEFLYAHEEPA